MKITLAIITFVAAASAQTWADIPACAQPCILDAAASTTDCADTDYACICAAQDTVEPAAEECVVAACGEEAAENEVLPAVAALCSSV
ncbi:hypothetical protein F5B22DRAFT_376134 [Xylaria bambusicola]|uniref:uncharacterized protein n=1 Tax=Xylaria bambusicola TaxID=326684 RepID=UPI00200725F5|nr:uncharacterized protein F5B22DRAFT_376134 [Xylaria bambusicola]KAI0509003.1 hypothetical protein F5B22DRAFT_376134 [Xylaria bambusicola]